MSLSIGALRSSGRGITAVARRLRAGINDGIPGISRRSDNSPGLAGTTGLALSNLRSGGVEGARSNLRAISGVRRALDIRA
jgi:hypothetical protein